MGNSIGKSFQKITVKPRMKYNVNITSPKINRNRFEGDFCSSILNDIIIALLNLMRKVMCTQPLPDDRFEFQAST